MSATKKIQDDEQTRIQEFNPAAPISKKKLELSKKVGRVSAGVGGIVAGSAVGFGVSSMAAGGHTNPDIKGLAPDSTLSDAATPEAELIGVEPDSTISNRERTTIDDPYELSNTSTPKPSAHVAVDDPSHVTEVKVEPPVSRHSAAVGHPGHQSQIISDDNHVIGGPVAHHADTHTAAEVTVVTAGDHSVVSVDVPGDDIPEASLTTPTEMEAMLVNENGIPVAHVDDTMSFSTAFAAARAQVGAGGVFEWHGNLYGTYYVEEWDGMSNGQRSDFMARVTFPADPEVPEIEDDFNLVITGLETADNGEGGVMYLATGELNGHQIVMMDQDGDGMFDSLYVDVDGDNGFNPDVDAVIPIADAGLSVGDVAMYLAIQDGYDPTMDMVVGDDIPDVPMPEIDDDLAMNDFSNDSIPDF